MITVLCAMEDSNYFKLEEDLDIWTKERDAWNYNGTNKVIAHPPCQQWSRLRKFAKEDQREKELAIYCYQLVKNYGGILEHPAGSTLFEYMGTPRGQIRSIDQSWFGFPARKRTYLYVNGIDLEPYQLSFNAVQKKVQDLSQKQRSKMPIAMCQWLVDSIKFSEKIWKE